MSSDICLKYLFVSGMDVNLYAGNVSVSSKKNLFNNPLNIPLALLLLYDFLYFYDQPGNHSNMVTDDTIGSFGFNNMNDFKHDELLYFILYIWN